MSADAALVGQQAERGYADQRIRRMAVAWQHPIERGVRPVGLLEYDGSVHRFRYLRAAANIRDFRPFVGFPRLDQRYESPELFPLFAQRVMSPRRPDYSEYLEVLDLSVDATPWEQLARTEGRSAGDTIQVMPEPTVDQDGRTWGQFLVAGIRWRLRDTIRREAVLDAISPGDRLLLVDEPENEKNSRAILTATQANIAIGWVPDMLLDYVHTVKDRGTSEVRVLHKNGPQAPNHMRLLVELRGTVAPGYVPFSGEKWECYS